MKSLKSMMKSRIFRNADDFRLAIYKKTYAQNSMWYDRVILFNELLIVDTNTLFWTINRVIDNSLTRVWIKSGRDKISARGPHIMPNVNHTDEKSKDQRRDKQIELDSTKRRNVHKNE
jgi:hypothetical protein